MKQKIIQAIEYIGNLNTFVFICFMAGVYHFAKIIFCEIIPSFFNK